MKKYVSKGVRFKQHKSDTILKPVEEFPYAKQLNVCVPSDCALTVSEKSVVRFGQCIARSADGTAARWAPCNGVIAAISAFRHPEEGDCAMLQITVAGIPRPEQAPVAGSEEELMAAEPDITRLEGLIDRLDGQPLTEKLRRFRKREIRILAVNAVDDQPYVCPSAGLARHYHQAITEGLEILRRLCGASGVRIFLYGSKGFTLYDPNLRRYDRDKNTVFIGSKYPARAMLELNQGPEYGFVGAQTCLDVVNMLRFGCGQTHTVVSVGGDFIGEPANYFVPVGTPIETLINACSPSEQHGIVILGGPMTGRYTQDMTVPVGLTTQAVLFMPPSTISASANCWGCASCVSVCPRNLMPLYIARFAKHGRFGDALELGAARCIECGCCSYVCSGGIDPMTFIVKAKRFGSSPVVSRPASARPAEPSASGQNGRAGLPEVRS